MRIIAMSFSFSLEEGLAGWEVCLSAKGGEEVVSRVRELVEKAINAGVDVQLHFVDGSGSPFQVVILEGVGVDCHVVGVSDLDEW